MKHGPNTERNTIRNSYPCFFCVPSVATLTAAQLCGPPAVRGSPDTARPKVSDDPGFHSQTSGNVANDSAVSRKALGHMTLWSSRTLPNAVRIWQGGKVPDGPMNASDALDLFQSTGDLGACVKLAGARQSIFSIRALPPLPPSLILCL